MRFLIDECLSRHLVDHLRRAGHDVVWAQDVCRGQADEDVLALATAADRIVMSEDRDYGELTVRLKRPAVGIVIAAIGEFEGPLDAIAEHVTRTIDGLGDSCIGSLTVIEPGRVRQRSL